MNPVQDVVQSVRAWLLDEGESPMTPDYIDDILARTATVEQRPAWQSPWRWLLMRTTDTIRTVPRIAWPVLIALILAALVFGVAAGPGSPRSAQPSPAPRYRGEFVPAPIPGDDGPYHRLGVLLGDGRVLLLAQAGTNVIYDPVSATYSVTGPTPERMMIMDTATALPDGRVLVVGEDRNARNADRPGDLALIFDPVRGRFAATAAPTNPHGQLSAAVLLRDGRVLLVGGAGGVRNGTISAQADVFDPAASGFVAAGAMSVARDAFTATVLQDGRVLVAGGRAGPDGQLPTATAELFDPATLAFAPTGSMLTPRVGHSATLLTDGRVLIAGGDGDTSSEIYDPASGTFTAGRPMAVARAWHVATPLADGTVLIAGGSAETDPPIAMASAEIYDPATDSFAPTGSMIHARSQASATRLGDGTVLVAGRTPLDRSPGVDAELYR